MSEYLFDATDKSPIASFAPLPAGAYKVVIKDFEKKNTKAGTGQYLSLTLEVTEGDHKGRSLWENLNLWNKSVQAVEIAEQALTQICHSTGKLKIKSYDELLFKPMIAHVKVRPENPPYGASNEVKMYAPIDDTTTTSKTTNGKTATGTTTTNKTTDTTTNDDIPF